jgi:anthranilate/para-aminobenzoate synthase component I
MTIATDIHADLITPLGAYLRLREGGGASFLLESVEKGRLGRYSLVGSGARLVAFDEAEREVAAGRPVVGYLGYDHVARLEPTVQLPDDGLDLPESRFVVVDSLVRFDHAAAQVRGGGAACEGVHPRG